MPRKCLTLRPHPFVRGVFAERSASVPCARNVTTDFRAPAGERRNRSEIGDRLEIDVHA